MSNTALDMTKVHPLNPLRPPASETGFKVKKWKPIYDQIVAGHIIGKSNKELAELYDFTTVHISNILRSDNAQILISEASKRIRETVIEESTEIVELQQDIKELATKRLKEFLVKKELADASPFMFFDRALKVAAVSATSTPQTPQPQPNINIQVNNQNNAVASEKELKSEHLGRIAKALELSDG